MPMIALATSGAEAFAKWVDANQYLVASAAAGIAVVGAFGTALLALGIAAKLASLALSGAALILAVVKGLMLLVGSPIFLTIAALAALVAALVLFSGTVRGLVGTALNFLGETFGRIAKQIKMAWGEIARACGPAIWPRRCNSSGWR